MGDRAGYISRAIEELESHGIKVRKRSTVIETEPVDGPVQGKYLNTVVEATTDLSPERLLKQLQSIESNLGRVRDIKNGPRTIDLDILLYDHFRLNTPVLVIPHPRMRSRDFVLEPLKEIAPHLFQGGSLCV